MTKLNIGCPFINCCSNTCVDWHWSHTGEKTYMTHDGFLTDEECTIKSHIFDNLFQCENSVIARKPDIGRLVQLIGYLISHYSEENNADSEVARFYDGLSD